jgi:ankyrin repeat protein
MKQHVLARMRAALDEIEQNAPADLALFEYVDLLTAQVAELAAPRDLRSAAEAGDLHTTRALLRKPGVDVDAETENGTTAMYLAAAHGLTVVVEVLADEGQADVSKSTRDGFELQLVECDTATAYKRAYVPLGQVPPLYIAARNGRLDTVRALLQRGADVGQATGREATALHGASRDGRTAVITDLLDHGANADKANSYGDTPVCNAAHGGHVEAIKLLLDHGADVDKANKGGETCLWTAVRHGHVGTLKVLLGGGADVNKADCNRTAPVHIAAYCGHAEAVEILLAAGATISADHDNDGNTAFLDAALGGYSEIITLLLDHGGAADLDINQVSGEGDGMNGWPDSTALLFASQGGHVEVMKIVLERGADVDKANVAGETPVWAASNVGHVEAVELLLGHNVDMNTADNDGRTPMYAASAAGHTGVVEVLLAAGAITDGFATDGFTPFLAAAKEGHSEIITLLLNHGGVDINQVGEEGEDFLEHPGSAALILASEGGHVETIKVLIKRGADVNKPNNGGETPVYSASMAGHADAVHVLLKVGAVACVANQYGYPALHKAAQYNHVDVIRVLAEVWPTNPLAWRMFLMGGGAASELQDYLVPPANRTTRNHLPRLYSKPDMVKEIYKYLYKPRYADLNQVDNLGRTALQMAEIGDNDAATLLQALSLG